MNEERELKEKLGKTVRVVIDDDRVIEGEFQCIDKDMNLIIGNATEFHRMLSSKDPIQFVDNASKLPSRHLGMAMVPGKHLVGVFSAQ
jgi:small nuclear ribonucleoprotein (snRNP)-like protein